MNLEFKERYSSGYSSLHARSGFGLADFKGNLTKLLNHEFKVNKQVAHCIAGSLYWRMCNSELHYHTPLHILSMFHFAHVNSIELEPWEQLAVWFHDAVYDPAAKALLNEQCSAFFASALLWKVMPEDAIKKVVAGIMATALHARRVEEKYGMILDLDLCSFAWNRQNYQAAGQAIAREFIPVFGAKAYESGRIKFLKKLLAKSHIYRTKFMREKYEAAARENIKSSIKAFSC